MRPRTLLNANASAKLPVANVEAENERQKDHPCLSQTEAPSCGPDDNLSSRRTLQIVPGYLRGSAVCERTSEPARK
jgi:hypothetical protein